MPLVQYSPRRSSAGAVQVNSTHWLARNLLFAHSGRVGFVGHRPTIPNTHAKRRDASKGNISCAAVYGNNADYEEYDITGMLPLAAEVTLSVWALVDSIVTTSPPLNSAMLSIGGTTFRSGISIQHTINSVNPALRISTASTVANINSGVGSAGTLQHILGTRVGTGEAKIYIDGKLIASSAVQMTFFGAPNAVLVGADRHGTSGAIAGRQRTVSSFAALQVVLDRVLDENEVLRLYEEQRSDPWQLFAPQQIYIPTAAASGLPTLSLPTAIDITATSFRPRVSYQY